MNKMLKGHAFMGEVLREWEGIVNRVVKREVWEMIVCSMSARWWDSEVKDTINSRRQVY